MDEIIKPRSKAMTEKQREDGREEFRKRYGAWYYFNYKKYSTFRPSNKAWIEKFDKQSNRDKQGW
tara:strand:- start:15818 stop:16012 length:195 start_codon:yes stop_codon:yes gene_type:complete